MVLVLQNLARGLLETCIWCKVGKIRVLDEFSNTYTIISAKHHHVWTRSNLDPNFSNQLHDNKYTRVCTEKKKIPHQYFYHGKGIYI